MDVHVGTMRYRFTDVLPCQDYVAIHRFTPVRWPRHLGPFERRLFGREQTTGANRVLVARRTLRVLTTSRLRSPSPLQSSLLDLRFGPATLRADPVASVMAPLYDTGEFVVVEHQRPIISTLLVGSPAGLCTGHAAGPILGVSLRAGNNINYYDEEIRTWMA